MQEFTRLLTLYRAPIARYVHFRISSYADAEDVLQEICLYAYQRFPALRDRQAFLAWLMAIARTKCADYFRACARRLDLPMELREEQLSGTGVHGRSQKTAVRETLSAMARSEQKILYLYYYEQLPQADIA